MAPRNTLIMVLAVWSACVLAGTDSNSLAIARQLVDLDIPAASSAGIAKIKQHYGSDTNMAKSASTLLRSMLPAIREETAAVIAEHFTLKELKHLHSLRTDPVFKRYYALTPLLKDKSSTIVKTYIQQNPGEMQHFIEAVVKDKDSAQQPLSPSSKDKKIP